MTFENNLEFDDAR